MVGWRGLTGEHIEVGDADPSVRLRSTAAAHEDEGDHADGEQHHRHDDDGVVAHDWSSSAVSARMRQHHGAGEVDADDAAPAACSEASSRSFGSLVAVIAAPSWQRPEGLTQAFGEHVVGELGHRPLLAARPISSRRCSSTRRWRSAPVTRDVVGLVTTRPVTPSATASWCPTMSRNLRYSGRRGFTNTMPNPSWFCRPTVGARHGEHVGTVQRREIVIATRPRNCTGAPAVAASRSRRPRSRPEPGWRSNTSGIVRDSSATADGRVEALPRHHSAEREHDAPIEREAEAALPPARRHRRVVLLGVDAGWHHGGRQRPTGRALASAAGYPPAAIRCSARRNVAEGAASSREATGR